MPPRILSAQKPLNRLAAPTWTTLNSNPACSLSSSAAGPTPVSTPPPTPSSAQSHARVPRVIFSGIQPTGIPHVGNYLGALRNWVDLQKDAQPADELLFSSVGLHALTMPQDPAVLAKERREMLATLVAIGLDPARSVLFRQEDVPEHTQLCWILSCLASFGRLRRITTWKSKIDIAAGTETQGKQASQQEEQGDSDDPEGNLNLGLFSYPVLQAADILLYKATHVPVGEDQIQHLELSRALAKRFNKVHKTRTFPTPTHLITPTARLSSLRDPTQKMSKSAPDGNSRIMLTDPADTVARKIKKAVTDSDRHLSYDPDHRPGVATLLELISGMQARSPTSGGGAASRPTPAEIAEELNSLPGSRGLVELKERATQAVNEALAPIQTEMKKIHQDPAYLDQVARQGAERAQARAADTMHQVKRAVGIL